VIIAQWDYTTVSLGVSLFAIVFSGGCAAWDRYSASSVKRRQEERDLATAIISKDCQERLAEKDRQIGRLETRAETQDRRITELERKNERLTVSCEQLTIEIQRLTAEIRRISPKDSGDR
jgi:predicted RNase H-like nuclease (RuvC/YqgF family)